MLGLDSGGLKPLGVYCKLTNLFVTRVGVVAASSKQCLAGGAVMGWTAPGSGDVEVFVSAEPLQGGLLAWGNAQGL